MDPELPGRMSCSLVVQTEGLLSVKPDRVSSVSYYPRKRLVLDHLTIALPNFPFWPYLLHTLDGLGTEGCSTGSNPFYTTQVV